MKLNLQSNTIGSYNSMERWNIVLLLIYMNSHLIFQESQAAPELKNYPECVQNSNGSALIGVEKRDRNNTASNCASYCKEKNFIFSGTKNYSCICGNALTIGIRTSSRCETRCPGNTTETCGGEDSVSLRRTGYESGTTKSPDPSRAETSSEINVSPKTDINASAEKGSQMIAVYITLPVVLIVAASAALIVYLVLRHRRQMRERNVSRIASRSFNFESDSQRNEILENHTYGILAGEPTTLQNQADEMCYAECYEYCTIVDSDDTFDDNKDYDKLNGKQATSARANYFLLPDTNETDNAYSHIGPASRKCMNKTQNTYNTFQFSPLTGNTSAPVCPVNDDKNYVYDRATTPNKSQANAISEYAHLNTGNNSK